MSVSCKMPKAAARSGKLGGPKPKRVRAEERAGQRSSTTCCFIHTLYSLTSPYGCDILSFVFQDLVHCFSHLAVFSSAHTSPSPKSCTKRPLKEQSSLGEKYYNAGTRGNDKTKTKL